MKIKSRRPKTTANKSNLSVGVQDKVCRFQPRRFARSVARSAMEAEKWSKANKRFRWEWRRIARIAIESRR